MTKAKDATVTTATAPTESVRDRILNTARELFYRDGVRGVGVDTVVAQSGVAKTSLYRWFPSKDVLIASVVEEEAKARWAGWDRVAARCAGQPPRECLRMHMGALVKFVNTPTYRGCPFMNVSAELPDPQHPARLVALEATRELRRRVRGLVGSIEGVRDPVELTDQLVLLIDGTLSAALCLGPDGPQKYLLTAADALVDAQLKQEGANSPS
jgi:AcrR family transcriptional regulator